MEGGRDAENIETAETLIDIAILLPHYLVMYGRSCIKFTEVEKKELLKGDISTVLKGTSSYPKLF